MKKILLLMTTVLMLFAVPVTVHAEETEDITASYYEDFSSDNTLAIKYSPRIYSLSTNNNLWATGDNAIVAYNASSYTRNNNFYWTQYNYNTLMSQNNFKLVKPYQNTVSGVLSAIINNPMHPVDEFYQLYPYYDSTGIGLRSGGSIDTWQNVFYSESLGVYDNAKAEALAQELSVYHKPDSAIVDDYSLIDKYITVNFGRVDDSSKLVYCDDNGIHFNYNKEGSAGFYVDYIYRSFDSIKFARKFYFNKTSENISWDSFKNTLSTGSTVEICILGLGSFSSDDEIIGFDSLASSTLKGWSYTRYAYDNYYNWFYHGSTSADKVYWTPCSADEHFLEDYTTEINSKTNDEGISGGDDNNTDATFGDLFNDFSIGNLTSVITQLKAFLVSCVDACKDIVDLFKIVMSWLPESIINIIVAVFSLAIFMAVVRWFIFLWRG